MNTVQSSRRSACSEPTLVECATEQDWSEHRWSELADGVRECFPPRQQRAQYAPAPPEQRLTRETLRRVVRFVHDNIDSKLTWDDIADGVGMDRYVFGRRFKLTTGITPHQYVIRCRIRKAKKPAHGRSSLADIAPDIGCSCQSHLRRSSATTSERLPASSGGEWPIAARRPTRHGAPFLGCRPPDERPGPDGSPRRISRPRGSGRRAGRAVRLRAERGSPRSR